MLTVNKTCDAYFTLPKFHSGRVIKWSFYIDESKTDHIYDIILDTDLLQTLGIGMKFNTKTIEWDEADIPMRYPDIKYQESYLMSSSKGKIVLEVSNRIKQILEAKYEKANLTNIVQPCTNLNESE